VVLLVTFLASFLLKALVPSEFFSLQCQSGDSTIIFGFYLASCAMTLHWMITSVGIDFRQGMMIMRKKKSLDTV
jgi:hypothetical protein